MNTLQELEADLLPCKKEHTPPLSPETQQLYNYARYHDLHNLWNGKPGDDLWQSMAVYYRIAAANGDYKANARLQYLLTSGRVISSTAKKEVKALNEQLMKLLPGRAHYNIYIYLKNGYISALAGDEFAYLRKAAELGNKEAQYELAEILNSIKDEKTYSRRHLLIDQLLLCASQQGLGEASVDLAIRLQARKKYSEATKIYHEGARNGDAMSARKLMRPFKSKIDRSKVIDYLALTPDPERAIRYQMIEEYLYDNSYLNPKVPDLDEIVPLPPAKLPAWDGKIAFQRWYEGASPPKPSEELMQKLADQAGLDVNTGLPKK
ncbi:DUF6396 domain-containing protein [Conservatibacter flavescens]|uniref:DUF6396 domain-containing protein n=1 Tax=Conservatibacter flavescens TaxID=28161 RepID=A0A2M8S0P8_9PAST|nr:DUF6396 domain-containing protein [Conservatibacter flavescens]PJG84705.1 hypothetical protein CVP05_09915 [Conservatibacter flavescens]